MLSKKVFTQGIKNLVSAFPNWGVKTEDKETMAFWFRAFEHNTERDFNCMIDEYVSEEKAYPTIAGLLDHGVRKSNYIDLSKYGVK